MPIEPVRPRERDVDVAAVDPASSSPGDTPPEEVKPAEDEWALFDPEQCGVEALLKKINHVK
jgi:hypothetical protein